MDGWGGSTNHPGEDSAAQQHIEEINEYLFKNSDKQNLIMNMIYYFRKYKLGDGEVKVVVRGDVNEVLEGIIPIPSDSFEENIMGRESPSSRDSRYSSIQSTQATQQTYLYTPESRTQP